MMTMRKIVVARAEIFTTLFKTILRAGCEVNVKTVKRMAVLMIMSNAHRAETMTF